MTMMTMAAEITASVTSGNVPIEAIALKVGFCVEKQLDRFLIAFDYVFDESGFREFDVSARQFIARRRTLAAHGRA